MATCVACYQTLLTNLTIEKEIFDILVLVWLVALFHGFSIYFYVFKEIARKQKVKSNRIADLK